MLTASEARIHVSLSLQAAGDAPMGARLDYLLFFFQGWHLATLGSPAHSGKLNVAASGLTWSDPGCSAIPRDRIFFHESHKLRPRPLPEDSARLLQGVLATYAVLPPYKLHQLALADAAQLGASHNREALAAAFAEKELPAEIASAGFAKQPYRPAPPAPEPLSEDQRLAMATERIAALPVGVGEGRFRAAVDVAVLLIAEYRLDPQGGRIFRDFCGRCSPAISRYEGDQCWRAAKRHVAWTQTGPSTTAEAQRYRFVPGEEAYLVRLQRQMNQVTP